MKEYLIFKLPNIGISICIKNPIWVLFSLFIFYPFFLVTTSIQLIGIYQKINSKGQFDSPTKLTTTWHLAVYQWDDRDVLIEFFQTLCDSFYPLCIWRNKRHMFSLFHQLLTVYHLGPFSISLNKLILFTFCFCLSGKHSHPLFRFYLQNAATYLPVWKSRPCHLTYPADETVILIVLQWLSQLKQSINHGL